MPTSVRTLFAEIVDYAGLFPPAQLELEPAFRNFVRYCGDTDAWMLGRFVCPVNRLDGLSKFVAEIPTHSPPVRIAALGRGGDSAEAFLAGIAADLAAIGALEERSDGRMLVDGFETKLPAEIVAGRDGKLLRNLLDAVAERFDAAGRGSVRRFYEAALGEPWREALRVVIAGIARHNHKITPQFGPDFRVDRSPKQPPDGLKLRTGGVAAAAFPTTEQVAYAIEQCRDAHVPMKFTAGLHHPLRRFDPGVRTMMHGFLNVFAAIAFAHAAAFDFHDILAVIEELDANAFQFSDEYLSWNDADASIDEIQYSRRERGLSFGSCSFDEPREDLKAMRLL
jgi:hypothetical protein